MKTEIQRDSYRRYWIWQSFSGSISDSEPNINAQNRLKLVMWNRGSDLELLFPRYMESAVPEKILHCSQFEIKVVQECPEYGFRLAVPIIKAKQAVTFRHLHYLGEIAKKTGKTQRWNNFSIEYCEAYGDALEYGGYWLFNRIDRFGAKTSRSLEEGCAWLINFC